MWEYNEQIDQFQGLLNIWVKEENLGKIKF